MRNITQELITAFEAYLVEEEKSRATKEKYIRDVSAFAVWLCGRAVDKHIVLEYKTYFVERYKPASVNSVLSSLASFFIFNEWYDCKVKSLKIQRRIFASEQKELSKNEYERLLNEAKRKNNRRLYLVMQAICSTGIRVSELKFITVKAVASGAADINCKGKMRRVFLPQTLCKILAKYANEQKITSGAVFVTKSGKPLDRSNIWKDMKKLCESAGVARDKVFPHNLRHLFARTYYSLQKDIVRLADVLGHSSVDTTRIYTMESGDEHRRQIERLGFVRSKDDFRLTT